QYRILCRRTSWTPGRLSVLVARRIEYQLPQYLTIGIDDAHLTVGDEQHDGLAAVAHAETDVVQPRVVAQGDLAVPVDGVVADAEVHQRRRGPRPGLHFGIEDLLRRPPSDRAVRAVQVVVNALAIQLRGQLFQRRRGRLLREPALLGLMEALDLAAGLRVVWRGVLAADAQALELGLQEDLALTR